MTSESQGNSTTTILRSGSEGEWTLDELKRARRALKLLSMQGLSEFARMKLAIAVIRRKR